MIFHFVIALLLLCGPSSAPSDAKKTILFDGKDFAHFTHRDGKPVQWKLADDGAMEVSGKGGDIITKDPAPANDFVLHVEFMVPNLPPDVKGQARGNSGVYLLGRYEVQVLDSFGLTPTLGDCGAIYSIKVPDQNACKPPGEWQTYDITFHAPRWDMGKKVQNAQISVIQNGVKIHEDVEIPKPTGSEIAPEGPGNPGPALMLQDHGNPVRYRNIWMAPLEEEK